MAHYFNLSEEYPIWNMSVAIHNPSSVNMTTARVALPKCEFSAMVYKDRDWDQNITYVTRCHDEYRGQNVTFESCFMDISVVT